MSYVHITILFTAALLIIIGLYSAIFIDNIIKKIIGISFIEEGVNLFIVALGYAPDGVVPIIMPGMDPAWFAANAAYPLPFGLVLLALVMVLYRRYGTLSTKVMLADTSKQEEYNE